MNVRFAPREIRFRITRDELAQLASGRALSMSVPLPGQRAFNTNIATDRLGRWRLDSDPTGLWLAVPVKELDSFADGVPTTDGLSHAFELADGKTLEVNFEVDVRA
jgi:hypothetical protein